VQPATSDLRFQPLPRLAALSNEQHPLARATAAIGEGATPTCAVAYFSDELRAALPMHGQAAAAGSGVLAWFAAACIQYWCICSLCLLLTVVMSSALLRAWHYRMHSL
jgi:hypothetical protein